MFVIGCWQNKIIRTTNNEQRITIPVQNSLEKKESIKLNRKISISLFCILISTVLWLLISLSANNNSSYIDIPVSFEGFDHSKTITNKLPSHLKLRVTTNEFKIFINRYFFGKDTVKIVSNALNLEERDGKSFILTKDIQTEIEEQLRPHIKILSVIPDTIHFFFDRRTEKKIPVKLKANLSYEKQYELADSIKLTPDSITVSGSEKLLNKISYIETVPLQLNSLKENTSKNVLLNKSSMFDSNKNINYDTNRISISSSDVNILIPIEKYTESTVEVNILTEGFISSAHVVISPLKVKIKYHVSFSNFDKVNPDMFTASINNPDFKYAHSGKTPVIVMKKPEFVKITRIEPEKVDYIIK